MYSSITVIVPAGFAQLPGLLVAMALGSWVAIHLLLRHEFVAQPQPLF